MRPHDVVSSIGSPDDDFARQLFDAVREVQHRPHPSFGRSVGGRAEMGACHVLATLIHQRVGGEFIAIVEEMPRRDSMRHVAILVDGRVLDGRGSTSVESWVAENADRYCKDPRARIAIVPRRALGMHLGSAALRDDEQISTLSPLADAVVAARFTDERLWHAVVPQPGTPQVGQFSNTASYDVLMARPMMDAPAVDLDQLRLVPGLIDRNADFKGKTLDEAFEDRTMLRRQAIAAGWRGSPEVISPERHLQLDVTGEFAHDLAPVREKVASTARRAARAAAMSQGFGRW